MKIFAGKKSFLSNGDAIENRNLGGAKRKEKCGGLEREKKFAIGSASKKNKKNKKKN